MTTHTTDIVILGAGIGGYEAFRTLQRQLKWYGIKKTITIVDEHNYFTFTPLLHEVASGAVEPSHCTFSLRELVYNTPHTFIEASVTKVDAEKKIVETSTTTIHYQYCVMALGSGVNFFGTPGADQYAYTVRTLPKAMHLRESLVRLLETQPKNIAMTVVGGGPTGIEVASQMAWLYEKTLKKLFPKTKMTIRIIEASPGITPQLPPKAQRLIMKRLAKLRVDLVTNTKVAKVGADTITTGDGQELPSDFTIWCSGIHNLADCYMHEDDCEKNRLPVTNYLNHTNYPELYGVGDIALGFNPGSDKPWPQLGEAAHQQGEYVGKHIVAMIRGTSLPPFAFHTFGTLMPIGDRYGIAVIRGVVLSGLFAWWLRRTAYVLFMPGLLRKLKLVIAWTLHLFSFSYIIDINHKK